MEEARKGSLVMLAACLLLAARSAAADGITFGPDSDDGDKYSLPDGFLIGSSTSSYQTEGAWNLSGKGLGVFDHYYNIQGFNPDPEHNGNVATDAYHHINDDIEIIRQLKLQIFRFSISWERVLPDGDPSKPNQDGVRYYNETINKLRDIGVEPLVTMFHFDYPYSLREKYDGWLGRGMVDAFVDYADFLFRTFGDRVKYWNTLNEPNMNCNLVYYAGIMAPGNASFASESLGSYYTCVHHQQLAHGRASRLYRQKYASAQGGKLGISCDSRIHRPNSTSYEDIQAASRANAFAIGVCVAPVVLGDYPEIAIKILNEKSLAENLPTSMLPEFTVEEKAMLKNSSDFIGLNVYQGYFAADERTSSIEPDTTPSGKFRLNYVRDASAVAEDAGDVTWAMHWTLTYAQDNFGNVPIFITENGFLDTNGIHDQERAASYSAYMRTMVETIKSNGVNVLGHIAWALTDDFEWSKGYRPKMGLVHVDFSSPNRTRTLKDSSAFFIKLASDRKVPLVLPTPPNSSSPRGWPPHPALYGALCIMSIIIRRT